MGINFIEKAKRQIYALLEAEGIEPSDIPGAVKVLSNTVLPVGLLRIYFLEIVYADDVARRVAEGQAQIANKNMGSINEIGEVFGGVSYR